MDPATLRRVDERLDELYRRHLEVEPEAVTGVYRSGRGYLSPAESAEEQGVFGVCLASVDGEVRGVGDDEVPFALQSISKIVSYGMALDDHGAEHVLARVGVEPSGDSFYSLEFDRRNRPFNPMVNAGALVTSALVKGADAGEKLARILDAMRRLAGNPALDVDAETFAAELRTADRNRATAYLMRSNGILDSELDVEEMLALYLRQCSVTVTCRDLATMAATLANGCTNPVTGEQAFPRHQVRNVLSVMHTCGMYDFAGAWAFSVGVPAKSGVSGGILAVVPGKLGIAVYSPGLDDHGNSVRGTRVCQEISERLGLHVFASETEDSLLGSARPR